MATDTNPESSREEELFEAAMQWAPEYRSAFLAAQCPNDHALRERVEALLRAHQRAEGFLEPELKNLNSASTMKVSNIAASVIEQPGDRIGRYKLLQKIGEGGCGVVYMAEQTEPVKRRVALKVIKLGMDTKSVIARFEAERQALAMMDHPNIAKVFDAGTTRGGQPYFVMELVKGIPITTFCDERRLSIQERLELFVPVCHAIQHAHQKGIIHRDIKPSNVLVALYDGEPVAKVIDFGIAKATGQQLTERTFFTELGAVIGTLEYMSPEQAELNQLDVDTRSDIYSLGVLLYQLLTGTTPLTREALRKAAVDEVLRRIREDEPPKPSTRLSEHWEHLTAASVQRKLDPARLTKLVRGDLDWIAMKCLEKDRKRRYETADGLAADIRRHLSNEPVVARPPSNLYRFQKLARRNKVAFSLSSAIAAVILVGSPICFWLYGKEKDARGRAVTAERVQTKLREESDAAKSNAMEMKLLADQQRERAEREKTNALWMEFAAKTEASNAFSMKLVAERQSRNSEARRLLTEANHAMAEQPQRGLLLLVEAANIHTAQQEPPLLEVAKALASALTNVGGLALSADSSIGCVATSSDARWLGAGGWQGEVTVWDLKSTDVRRSARKLPGHTSAVSALSISPDGKWLVSGAWDGSVSLWDLQNESLSQQGNKLPAHRTGINAILFSSRSQWLATASEDGTAKIWDLRASETLSNPKVFNQWLAAVNAAAFTADERWLVTGYDDGTIGISDLCPPEGTAATRFLKAHKGPINAISIGPDDHSVATASEDGTIGAWNLSAIGNPEEIKRLAGHSGPVHHVLHSGDGKLLVTGGFDGTVRVWDLTSRDSDTPRNVLAAHSKGVSWYTSGTAATTANQGAKWKLTDLKSLTTRARDSYRDSQSAVALQSFLRKSLPRFVQRPQPPSNLRIAGNNVREVKAGGVTAIAINTDNRWLVTAGSDGFVKIWDLRSANLISCKTVLKGHEEWVSSVRLGAADAYIATGSWDGAVRLWAFGGEKKELNAVHAHFSRLDKIVTKIPNLFQRSEERSEDRELGAELIDWAHDICARNLTRGEWERHFPGQPYKKTFNDLPTGAEKD